MHKIRLPCLLKGIGHISMLMCIISELIIMLETSTMHELNCSSYQNQAELKHHKLNMELGISNIHNTSIRDMGNIKLYI